MKRSPTLLKSVKAAALEASWTAIDRAIQFGTPVIIWEDGAVKNVDPMEMWDRLAKKYPKSAKNRRPATPCAVSDTDPVASTRPAAPIRRKRRTAKKS